jgi:uncharacterized damage-inducible protein DinB
MFERECTIYAFLLGYAQRLVSDIEDARFVEQPAAGVNHPAWLLGHLAVAGDLFLRMLGEPIACPKEWVRTFGPGSRPSCLRTDYPSKAELLVALERTHQRVTQAARKATPEAMAEPHSIDFLRDSLPTRGDLLAHVMTSHEGMHLGHLSNWRRQMGMPYIF